MLQRTPYWLIYMALVAILFGLSFFIPVDTAIPIKNQLADPAKASLDFLLEMTKLITTLNTALLGAAGAITVKGKEWSASWNRADGILVVVALICAAISYYGTYLGYIAVLEMVYNGTIYPFSVRLRWATALQYYGTLAGVFFLGLIFTRMLEGRFGRNQTEAFR